MFRRSEETRVTAERATVAYNFGLSIQDCRSNGNVYHSEGDQLSMPSPSLLAAESDTTFRRVFVHARK